MALKAKIGDNSIGRCSRSENRLGSCFSQDLKMKKFESQPKIAGLFTVCFDREVSSFLFMLQNPTCSSLFDNHFLNLSPVIRRKGLEFQQNTPLLSHFRNF